MSSRIVQLENGNWVIFGHEIGGIIKPADGNEYPTEAACQAAWSTWFKKTPTGKSMLGKRRGGGPIPWPDPPDGIPYEP